MYIKMNILNYYYCKLIIISSLLIKIGSAPFHFWFPIIIEGLSWLNSLILITWQKFAPLILISYFNFDNIILIPIILSSLIGSIGGLNQVSIRKLIAYSSINHLRWILIRIINNNNIWILYFLIYSLLNFIITIIFHEFKISYINQLTFIIFNSKLIKFFIFINLLSLGGLPPFLGFFPKWLIIQEIVINKQIILILILIITTLISLFYYIRIRYTTFLLNHYEINWIKFSFHRNYWKFILILSIISLIGLFLISSIYFFL